MPTICHWGADVSKEVGTWKWGDSGVTSESWVWMESVEDDGSRSGQVVWQDAQFVVLSICTVRLSHGPSCDRMQLCAVQHRGQFNVMQLDSEPCGLGCSLMTCMVVSRHGRDGE